MHRLRIDDQFITVEDGVTLLDAARRVGIAIPTMCHKEGWPHFTSCMLCVVRDSATGKMLPACSALASDGMLIETASEAVRAARKAALDLLLSDHVGDCEAPCHRVCPAHMNIPLMIRLIAERRFADALRVVKEDIALPAVLGRICPAPCENGCRRKQVDAPVSICLLKRFVADADLARPDVYRPACRAASGKRVAVVGAGPAGLSAAYYLSRLGHACTLLEKAAVPGGALRTGVPESILPRGILDAEIGVVLELGVTLRTGVELGRDVTMDGLCGDYDAVVLATGAVDDQAAELLGVTLDKRGVRVDKATYGTSRPGVFAGGACVGPAKLAVRAVGHGKELAVSVDQYLRGVDVTGPADRFNSVMGKLQEGEGELFMASAEKGARVEPAGGTDEGMTPDEAVAEAGRCLHCDCRKPEGCRLRQLATEYGAVQSRFKPTVRRTFEQRRDHPTVIFEQGKCIACGLCIRTTREKAERLGLSFIRRGIETRIGVPFGEALSEGLKTSADACVAICPTGALSFSGGEDPPLTQRDRWAGDR